MQTKFHPNRFLIYNVLVTDKSKYKREDVINFHNDYVWVDESPYRIIESLFQGHFSINVWTD